MKKILVTGACGQLGSELTPALINRFGAESVIATDIRESFETQAVYENLDVLDKQRLSEIIDKYNITEIYHLAAVLSARAETNPLSSWDINMTGLLNVLEICVEKKIQKVYWPSSIAVFGPHSERINTPQNTVMDPGTVYGISKLAGERWMAYYHEKYGLDTRSLRYPGIISYKTLPGGGTTDYAVDIFFKAVEEKPFDCFLKADTTLPMMYIDDAIHATINLMESDSKNITIRSSYNLAAISFTPEEIYRQISRIYPNFQVEYIPDFRQKIAESWPQSIDDSVARNDWGWNHQFDLEQITNVMLTGIKSLTPSR